MRAPIQSTECAKSENGFILNGLIAQETGFSGAGAIPNLDSIGEFRIITNNFDAEYGNYSGGQINVVTKSGREPISRQWLRIFAQHRFDAANYFAGGQRGAYHQNQFGGTVGGPIMRDKIFFFADYQGNRVIHRCHLSHSRCANRGDRKRRFLRHHSSLTTNTVSWCGFGYPTFKSAGLSGNCRTSPITSPGAPPVSQCVFPNAHCRRPHSIQFRRSFCLSFSPRKEIRSSHRNRRLLEYLANPQI